MSFTVRRESGGVVVIGVDGQLIVSNRHELKERVSEAVDFGSRKVLVQDTTVLEPLEIAFYRKDA